MHLHIKIDWKGIAGVAGTIANVVIQTAPQVSSSDPAVIHGIGVAVQLASAYLLLASEFGLNVTKPPAPTPPAP